jgi:hypothetical protein
LHLIKLYLYASLGLFQQKTIGIGLIVALAAVLSTSVMKFVLPRVSKGLFMRAGYSAMVISGVLMLNSAVVHIKLANDPDLRVIFLAEEVETTLTWKTLVYSVEFNYSKGLEFEKIVPLSSLSIERQRYVQSLQDGATKIIIEKVYSLTAISYEINYFDAQNRLIKKIEFD